MISRSRSAARLHFAFRLCRGLPRLDIASEDRSKPIEINVSGNSATLKYKDGGELVATLEDGKRLRYAFCSVPAGYRNAFYEMFIPGNFNQGGTWTVDGAQSGSFFVPNVPKQPPIETAVSRNADGKGYTIEAAIPWSALDDYRPKEGDTLLFDIAIDDAPEGGERRTQLMWNGTARNSSDRSAWGRLSLVP